MIHKPTGVCYTKDFALVGTGKLSERFSVKDLRMSWGDAGCSDHAMLVMVASLQTKSHAPVSKAVVAKPLSVRQKCDLILSSERHHKKFGDELGVALKQMNSPLDLPSLLEEKVKKYKIENKTEVKSDCWAQHYDPGRLGHTK